MSARRRRDIELKSELMRAVPYCTDCASQLFFGSGVLSPSLVANHLFCQRCVGKVRQRKVPVQLAIIAEMKRPKPALAAGLAGVVALAGCCQCPPPSASVAGIPVTVQGEPRRQHQSTITIHDGGSSVQIQTTSGGNVTSRVSVGPDGKMEVQEVEVSPSK